MIGVKLKRQNGVPNNKSATPSVNTAGSKCTSFRESGYFYKD